jgi:phage-related protein
MVIRTRHHFYINGTKSTSVGLNVEFLQPVPMAVQDYTEWTTGSDILGVSRDDTFQNIQYDIEARVLRSPDGFDSSAIYALFANAQTLSLSTVPGYYYKIRKVLGITPSAEPELRGNSITYLISLELAPFKYHMLNDPVEITLGAIRNPGTRYSRPLYKITNRTAGLSTVSLIVNGRTYKIDGLTDSDAIIFIDAEKMLCYSKTAESASTVRNIMSKSTGQIPFLAPGDNACRVNNGTLTVTGNWRSY